MDLLLRIENLVCSKLITLSTEEIELLFVSHQRLAWKLKHKFQEVAKKKTDHTRNAIRHR